MNKITEDIVSVTFAKYEDAKAYVQKQGFDFWRGQVVSMGEGYEHIFIFEYPHKLDLNKVCRMADFRCAQRKVQPGDQLPRLMNFIQVSVKQLIINLK